MLLWESVIVFIHYHSNVNFVPNFSSNYYARRPGFYPNVTTLYVRVFACNRKSVYRLFVVSL